MVVALASFNVCLLQFKFVLRIRMVLFVFQVMKGECVSRRVHCITAVC